MGSKRRFYEFGYVDESDGFRDEVVIDDGELIGGDERPPLPTWQELRAWSDDRLQQYLWLHMHHITGALGEIYSRGGSATAEVWEEEVELVDRDEMGINAGLSINLENWPPNKQ